MIAFFQAKDDVDESSFMVRFRDGSVLLLKVPDDPASPIEKQVIYIFSERHEA